MKSLLYVFLWCVLTAGAIITTKAIKQEPLPVTNNLDKLSLKLDSLTHELKQIKYDLIR